MNSYPKSPSMFRFLMVLGVVLGIALSFSIGSVVVGVAFGLCLSFFSGIIYCRSMESMSAAK